MASEGSVLDPGIQRAGSIIWYSLLEEAHVRYGRA
jgi:hypothetical protein